MFLIGVSLLLHQLEAVSLDQQNCCKDLFKHRIQSVDWSVGNEQVMQFNVIPLLSEDPEYFRQMAHSLPKAFQLALEKYLVPAEILRLPPKALRALLLCFRSLPIFEAIFEYRLAEKAIAFEALVKDLEGAQSSLYLSSLLRIRRFLTPEELQLVCSTRQIISKLYSSDDQCRSQMFSLVNETTDIMPVLKKAQLQILGRSFGAEFSDCSVCYAVLSLKRSVCDIPVSMLLLELLENTLVAMKFVNYTSGLEAFLDQMASLKKTFPSEFAYPWNGCRLSLIDPLGYGRSKNLEAISAPRVAESLRSLHLKEYFEFSNFFYATVSKSLFSFNQFLREIDGNQPAFVKAMFADTAFCELFEREAPSSIGWFLHKEVYVHLVRKYASWCVQYSEISDAKIEASSIYQ